jgi:hypothetical protein
MTRFQTAAFFAADDVQPSHEHTQLSLAACISKESENLNDAGLLQLSVQQLIATHVDDERKRARFYRIRITPHIINCRATCSFWKAHTDGTLLVPELNNV